MFHMHFEKLGIWNYAVFRALSLVCYIRIDEDGDEFLLIPLRNSVGTFLPLKVIEGLGFEIHSLRLLADANLGIA